MTKHTEAAPLLPPASVDFNKLHDAMRAGTDGDKAVEVSVVSETLARPADDPTAASTDRTVAAPPRARREAAASKTSRTRSAAKAAAAPPPTAPAASVTDGAA